MMKRFFRISFLAFSVLALLGLSALAQSTSTGRGRKFKEPPPTARIQITVLHDVNDKPIENASVIFHELDSHDKGNMELRTNEDGKTVIDVLEIGTTVRFQVIAQGYQTYGQDFKIEKQSLNLVVKLSRPVKQYSIYTDHSKDVAQPAPAQVQPVQSGQQAPVPSSQQAPAQGQPQTQQPK